MMSKANGEISYAPFSLFIEKEKNSGFTATEWMPALRARLT